ncbi:DUF2589 domain-containing protein [Desulfovibrio cuneatus]|uniref:DUF2589 domain-containing protein n=1 Tax=Desulfovibrio cuneatus TaxID=159728 RepID=UPI0003FB44BF|nr:DUF2589 domain-containing protein [Desulfovibrio cuneatus]
MSELVSMGDQFKGLPMGDLIGGPLRAACDSQIQLANATADFIKAVGFIPNKDGGMGPVRTACFQYTKMIQGSDGTVTPYKAELNVPLLAIVKIPCLAVKKVDITFDMEVKSSFSEKSSLDASAKLSASAKFGFGPISGTVNISGSVASHKENARSSDNSAKYHVQVLAEDEGMPEGLARVLDILQASTEPILLDSEGKALDGNGKAIIGAIPGTQDAEGKERQGSSKAIAQPMKEVTGQGAQSSASA